jgi:hypothetical protein
MYYNTPTVNRYIATLKKHRTAVIAVYVMAALAALLFFRPEFVSSDALFWLSESKELQRTEANAFKPTYIGRLQVRVKKFGGAEKEALFTLQRHLEKGADVEQVESLFSSNYIYNDKDGEGSSLVKALPIGELGAVQMKRFVEAFHEPYARFVNEDFTEFTFLIYSDEPLTIERFEIPFPYRFSEPNVQAKLGDYLLYTVAGLFSIILLFRLIFRNYISAFAGISVIALTMIGTFLLIYLTTGISKVHVAMSLIVVSIALVDYLYFYYRWHVSQYKADTTRALQKMLNRNLAPAFWTSLITVIGLGSLLIVDSSIVKLLCLSVILSSTLAYLLNITFLPSLLSYFHVAHPKVGFARFCYYFANREIHYNKRYLQLFLGMTAVVIVMGGYLLLSGPERLFADYLDRGVMTLKVPYDEIDTGLIDKIDAFEKKVLSSHSGVESVHSAVTVLKMLSKAGGDGDLSDEQNLMKALFFFELYDLDSTLFDENALNITLSLHDADKTELVQWLQQYDGIPLYFTDMDTLLSSAKIDKTVILGFSLATALVIIGLIMGRIFRNKEMILVGFVVNAIPIVWFGLFIHLLEIALSLEVLIAMTIIVGLASDATVHFAYKYYRSRFFGRTQKHALEIMFFYSGVPVIIGSVVLIALFALLTLTDLDSLKLIGGYGAVLMLLSLLTDLFILPILLLAIDRFGSRA